MIGTVSGCVRGRGLDHTVAVSIEISVEVRIGVRIMKTRAHVTATRQGPADRFIARDFIDILRPHTNKSLRVFGRVTDLQAVTSIGHAGVVPVGTNEAECDDRAPNEYVT